MVTAKKITTPFNDGICELWSVDRLKLNSKLGTFNFTEETLGVKSYAEFKTLGTEVERVISIPFNEIVDKANQVMIINDVPYRIELIQKKDTFPVSLRITLTRTTIGYSK